MDSGDNTVIYESEKVSVFITECSSGSRKTRIFAVRIDDRTGLFVYLGGMMWSGRWCQYVFEPEKKTMWSSGCLLGVCNFLDKINREEREKFRKVVK